MAGSDRKKILAICGPTATGKTDFALEVCRDFFGEMVGADSMQIYRGLIIGTAALPQEEATDVKRHLIGMVPPEKEYSVAEYVRDAAQVIEGILNRDHLPVLCGGTGLYITSLLEGIRFEEQAANLEIRRRLEEEWREKGADYMLQKLAKTDPDYAAALHPNNVKRILRALERSECTGLTRAEQDRQSKAQPPAYDALCLALTFSSRQLLYERIERRVDSMLDQGLLEEAREVYQQRNIYKTAAQAIGYKEFFPYFENAASLESCVDKLKQATRNYAKRQLTWFGRMPEVQWLQVDRPGWEEFAREKIHRFLSP